jgi:FMN phosphatase YigB (HAD superfamily)
MNLTILTDLDDTLLRNSNEKFLPRYLQSLSSYLGDYASPEIVLDALMKSTFKSLETARMDSTIKERFDQYFYPVLNTSPEAMQDTLLDFYTNHFPAFNPNLKPDPVVLSTISQALEKEYQIAVATQPIFPAIATHERLRWAGLAPEEIPFEIISTYEDFHFGKPDPAYYFELIAQIGCPDTGFVMVGDDVEMDIDPAKAIGIATYWVNPQAGKPDLESRHTTGSLEDLHTWLDARTPEELAITNESYQVSMATMKANAAAIQTLLKDAPESIWEPGPDENTWQATEIICHLRDVDREVHLPRMEMIRDIQNPFLSAINADPWAVERDYAKQDGREALVEFIQARKELLSLTASLPEIVGEKEIRHTIFGPMKLEEILRIAARHDSLHVQQLHSLIHEKGNS